MSDEHDHSGHPHNDPKNPEILLAGHAVDPLPDSPDPAPPEDAGSQALSEALKSSFAIVQVVMVVLVIVFIGSGFFKVGPQEKAIILTFGRPKGEGSKALLGSGLHWALPYPIEEVKRIPFSQLQQVRSSIGWYNITPEEEALENENSPGNGSPSLNPAVDGYVITGDGNIVHSRATLIYHIEDPIKYEFNFVNASNTIQNALDNALQYAAARFSVDEILNREIVRFQDAVRSRVSDLLAREDVGVVVEQCNVQSRPPRFLKASFDSVLSALSARDKQINDAKSYQNGVLSRAEADSASRTNAAQADRARTVESVRADAQRFTDLLPSYQTNPRLFTSILLTEKLGQVLTNVQDKIYLPERADGKSRELRLQLSREPSKPATNAP